jgi:hypothetical protein
VRVPDDIKAEILRRCRRKCCRCFGLRGDLDVKDGQIAHINRDRTNAEIGNLVYLCLDCHKNYDSRNNRVQSYMPQEIRIYQTRLYKELHEDQMEWVMTVRASRADGESVREGVTRALSILRDCADDVTLTEGLLE